MLTVMVLHTNELSPVRLNAHLLVESDWVILVRVCSGVMIAAASHLSCTRTRIATSDTPTSMKHATLAPKSWCVY